MSALLGMLCVCDRCVWLFASCKALLSSTRTVSTLPSRFFHNHRGNQRIILFNVFRALNAFLGVFVVAGLYYFSFFIFHFFPLGIFVYCECCVWRDVKLHNGGLGSAAMCRRCLCMCMCLAS